MFELRNIKCCFVLNHLTPSLLLNFQKKGNYKIFRLDTKLVLTLYPSSKNRVHATGVKNFEDFSKIKKIFKKCGSKIRNVQINNSYWIKKPIVINKFHEFAQFCSQQRSSNVQIDLSNFHMHPYPNSIYLRHKLVSGTAIIFRKSVIILGAKKESCVKTLIFEVENILNRYINSFQKDGKSDKEAVEENDCC